MKLLNLMILNRWYLYYSTRTIQCLRWLVSLKFLDCSQGESHIWYPWRHAHVQYEPAHIIPAWTAFHSISRVKPTTFIIVLCFFDFVRWTVNDKKKRCSMRRTKIWKDALSLTTCTEAEIKCTGNNRRKIMNTLFLLSNDWWGAFIADASTDRSCRGTLQCLDRREDNVLT